ncbi:MAG TPA: hypothetical protein VGI03_04100 [Verrucomicrobiae bacterium]|jgi:hypothetical protein
MYKFGRDGALRCPLPGNEKSQDANLEPWDYIHPKRNYRVESGGKNRWKFYFFRRGFLGDFLADLELGGGGVASIRRNPSSKLNPFAAMAFVFTLLEAILALLFRYQKHKVKSCQVSRDQ